MHLALWGRILLKSLSPQCFDLWRKTEGGAEKADLIGKTKNTLVALPLILKLPMFFRTLPMFFRMMYKCSILVYFHTLNEVNKITSFPTNQSFASWGRIKDEADSRLFLYPLPQCRREKGKIANDVSHEVDENNNGYYAYLECNSSSPCP